MPIQNYIQVFMNSTDPSFQNLKTALQAFQSERLEKTYADFQKDPQYQPFCEFFFERVYGPRDFSFRNTSIRTLHANLGNVLHKGVVSAVGRVIHLHELSDHLDNQMTHKLLANGISPDTLDFASYAAAYRKLDNDKDRMEQIQLGVRCIRDFYRLSQMWIVGISLKTVSAAAKVLGMGRIMDFVAQGYKAFKTIRDMESLARMVEHREMEWHGRLLDD